MKASKGKMLLVRITARDARTMRALLAERTLDISCGGAQSLAGGGVTLNAEVEASAIEGLRQYGLDVDVLYDVEARARKVAKDIGKGNRFLGKDRYPRGLGRLVKKEDGDVVP